MPPEELTVSLVSMIFDRFRPTPHSEPISPIVDRDDSALRAALAHVSDGVIVCDAAGDIELVNAAARELATMARLEPGRQIFWPELEAARWRAVSAGVVASEELTIRVPYRRFLLVKAVPLEDGRSVLMLADRSESARIDRVRRDFVTNVSHELKTPVAAILALAEVTETALGDEDLDSATRFVMRMRSDASRLSQLVTDLLDLSRVEGTEELRIEAVDLQHLLQMSADSVSGVAESKAVKIRVENTEGHVDADPTQLGMAVSNLVRNAVQYSDTGEVTLRALRANGHVEIAVSDQGIGIGSDELDRIFERFYRVDRARSRETGGTGLGLSIVRHVATNHGGRVEVHSELGVGSVFKIILPAER